MSPACSCCLTFVPWGALLAALAAQVIDLMLKDATLGKHLKAPSISNGSTNLYAHGIFEQVRGTQLGRGGGNRHL